MVRKIIIHVAGTEYLDDTTDILIEKLRRFRALNFDFEDMREHSPLLKIVKDDRVSNQYRIFE